MSLNDPQWGKRGRSGPPDLDEIWRNVNRRLNEMFGRTTPPGDGEPPRRSLPIGGVGLLAALVLIVWLASGFYIVDEGRRGIVTHFGRFTEATQPGLRYHLPFPIAGENRRNRLPQQQSQEQDRQGIADADR